VIEMLAKIDDREPTLKNIYRKHLPWLVPQYSRLVLSQNCLSFFDTFVDRK